MVLFIVNWFRFLSFIGHFLELPLIVVVPDLDADFLSVTNYSIVSLSYIELSCGPCLQCDRG